MSTSLKANTVPAITFTQDWEETAAGILMPARPFTLLYDSRRLPFVRDTYNGTPTWSIVGFLQSGSGAVVSKDLKAIGGSEMMSQEYPIPADAREITMWFLNTGRSGQEHYDSNYGRNYTFRLTATDIRNVAAVVTSDPQTPYSGFGGSVGAAPDVSGVAFAYTVKDGSESFPPNSILRLQPSGETGPDGFMTWSVYGSAVPYRASITFDVVYTIDGQTYTDNNNGQGYTASQS